METGDWPQAKGCRANRNTPSTNSMKLSTSRNLPEEIPDHVDHLPVPGVHQDRVVIITNPAIAGRGVWQAILPRVVEPIALAVIARPHPPADRERLVAPA